MTTATKKAPKKAREKKDGLRKPQVRVLQALSKSKGPLSRTEISEKAPVDLAMLNSYIGSLDPAVRAKNDKKVMPSLLTLGLVKEHVPADDEGHAMQYVITEKGRKALTEAVKAAK